MLAALLTVAGFSQSVDPQPLPLSDLERMKRDARRNPSGQLDLQKLQEKYDQARKAAFEMVHVAGDL